MRSQVFGLIVPHPPIMVQSVGKGRARVTDASAAALRQAATLLERWNPDTVVIMSPHAPAVADAFVIETSARVSGDLGGFGADDVSLSYAGDPALADELLDRLALGGIPALDRQGTSSLQPGTLDHGVVVPMSFLDPEGRWPLLVLSLSWLPYEEHKQLGAIIDQAARALGRRIAFVASGDCSHRLTKDAPAGFDPRAHEFDSQLVDAVERVAFDELSEFEPDLVEAAGECGLRSFITLGGVAEPASARVLAYEAPWGVGYLTATVNEHLLGVDQPEGTDAPEALSAVPESGAKGGAAGSDESELVALARRAITEYLTTGRTLPAPALQTEGLPAAAGAFVSLHRQHMLRGCIGTIAPTAPTLADEVVRNAIQAATADPRFPTMTAKELEDLDISVDVLHPAEECAFSDLDPARYGVIVSAGWKRGLLLPDLEGVDSPTEQVEIACRKAGIDPAQPMRLERFCVDRYV